MSRPTGCKNRSPEQVEADAQAKVERVKRRYHPELRIMRRFIGQCRRLPEPSREMQRLIARMESTVERWPIS